MNNPLFNAFSAYEDELLRQYERHPMFLNIQKFSDEQFKHILIQYGEGISANFVKFLETALRQIQNEKAQEAILMILRDEIPATGPTHQQMRSRACEAIGIDPRTLASTALTTETQQAVVAYFDVVCNPARNWHNHDLALTTFVRVIGESLVGVVYRVFTQEIMRRFNVTEQQIEFYAFHWHHDEKGGTPFEGAELGHTEYYDIAMHDLLQNEDDLEEAKQVADMALNIRNTFQDQFI